jgi:hypothetical protein
MAWIFAMWVQCKQPKDAAATYEHFQGRTFDLSDGTVTTLYVTCGALSDPTCCWITPSNVSRSGVNNERDAGQLSEIGRFLYQILETAPPFWFAIAGVEVDDVRSEEDVVSMLRDTHLAYRGIVTTIECWHAAGEPAGYELFRPGYLWRPYQGEIYKGGRRIH